MKFSIRILALGPYTELPIDEDKFNHLKQARRCLTAALAIEEKYELLISNYLELEKECLNVATDYMVRTTTDYSGVFDIRLAFNRRVVNLLTSTKLYLDQLHQHVKSCVPENPDIASSVKALFSAEYDGHFEYRLMEALRNHVQHQGLAVHSTKLNSKWTSHYEDGELEFKVGLFTHKAELDGDKDFKKQVFREMGDKVDLLHAIRVYICSISKVHIDIRGLINEASEKARSKIQESISEYEAISFQRPVGLHAISIVETEPAGGIIEKIPLLLEWDDVRLSLIKKNKSIPNLNRRFVSSSTSIIV